MNVERVLGTLTVVAALLGAGCGGDGGSNGADGGAGGDGNGGDGNGSDGNGSDGNGSGGDGGAGSDGSGFMGNCNNGSGSGSGGSSCTDAENKAYSDCITTKCGDKYEACLGPNYTKGDFGGLCGDYYDCILPCCGDIACIQNCGTPSTDCLTCMNDMNTCTTSMCPAPACATGGAGGDGDGTSGGGTGGDGTAGGAHTCADLMACCASISDANTKSGCEQAYAGVKDQGDSACNTIFNSLVQAGYCK